MASDSGDEYQKCGNCIYWQEVGGHLDGPNIGNCRRYPPTIHPDSNNLSDLYGESPQTRSENWCGEWAMNDIVPAGDDPA